MAKRKPKVEPSPLALLLKAQHEAVHGKPERKKGLPRTKTTYRCCTPDCGATSTTQAGADAHSDTTGHCRIEQLILDEQHIAR